MFEKKKQNSMAKIKEFDSPLCCDKPMKFQNACGTDSYVRIAFLCTKCNKMKVVEL